MLVMCIFRHKLNGDYKKYPLILSDGRFDQIRLPHIRGIMGLKPMNNSIGGHL